MRFAKHVFSTAIVFLFAMIVAACGNATSTTTGASSGSTPAATTSTSSSSNAVIQTATATLGGKSATILTNDKGFTLYYLNKDTATKVACSGGCAKLWPPLLQTGSGSPTGPSSLSGTLSVASTANGDQIEYNGHPLYTYSGDTAPGQTNGEGFHGVWFAVTSDLQPQSGTPNGY
jgi:predicted lipoprotein with Yx(FWY)xxD motif